MCPWALSQDLRFASLRYGHADEKTWARRSIGMGMRFFSTFETILDAMVQHKNGKGSPRIKIYVYLYGINVKNKS